MSWSYDINKAKELFKITNNWYAKGGQQYCVQSKMTTQEEINIFNMTFTNAYTDKNIDIYKELAQKGGHQGTIDIADLEYLAGLDGEENISEEDFKLFYNSLGVEFKKDDNQNVRYDDKNNRYEEKPIYENGVYKGKEECKYDTNGNLLYKRNYDQNDKFEGNATVYTYDENGKLVKEDKWVQNGSNHSGSLQNTKFYDNRGNVIKEVNENIGSSDGCVYEYKYDENNKLVEKVSMGSEHQSPRYINSVEKYDPITGKILESANGRGGVDKKYFYDEKGNLLKVERYSIKYPDGDYSDSQRFSVDYHRNPILGMQIATTTYEYDENNNLTNERQVDLHGDISHFNYTYNENNQLVETAINNEWQDPYQDINNSTPIPEHLVAKVSFDPNTGEASGITTYSNSYPTIPGTTMEDTSANPTSARSTSYDKNGKYKGSMEIMYYNGEVHSSTSYGSDGFRDEIDTKYRTYKFTRTQNDKGQLVEIMKVYDKDGNLIPEESESSIIGDWQKEDAANKTQQTADIQRYLTNGRG